MIIISGKIVKFYHYVISHSQKWWKQILKIENNTPPLKKKKEKRKESFLRGKKKVGNIEHSLSKSLLNFCLIKCKRERNLQRHINIYFFLLRNDLSIVFLLISPRMDLYGADTDLYPLALQVLIWYERSNTIWINI